LICVDFHYKTRWLTPKKPNGLQLHLGRPIGKANGTVKRCPGRDLLRKIFPAMFRAAIQMKHRVNMKDMKGIGGDQDGQVDGADGTVGTVGIGIGIDLNGDGMVGVGVGTGIVGSHGATGVEVDMVVTVDMVDGEVEGEMVGEMDGLGNHQVGPTGPVGPIGPGLGILMPRMHSLNSMAPGGQVNRSNLKQVMKNDGNLKPRINWKMRRARRRIRIPLVWVNCLEMPPVLDFRVFRNNQPWRKPVPQLKLMKLQTKQMLRSTSSIHMRTKRGTRSGYGDREINPATSSK